MSNSLRFALLVSASLLTGCASNHADAPSPSPSPSTVGKAPSPSPAPTAPAASPAFSGKIKLAALPLLPPGKTAPASGYPGKTWRFGAFVSEDQWTKFLAAAGVTLSKIDWKHQVVAYLVLDAQTNALTYTGTRTDGDTVTLLVDRSGIEPFYPDSTPAVLAVIDRKNVDSLAVKIAGGPSDLGKISIK